MQPQQPERSRHAASLDLHSASQHHAALALIREQLCFISIYFVRLLTRCALRSLFPHFTSFQLARGFMGTLHFLIEEKPVSWEITFFPCLVNTVSEALTHSYISGTMWAVFISGPGNHFSFKISHNCRNYGISFDFNATYCWFFKTHEDHRNKWSFPDSKLNVEMALQLILFLMHLWKWVISYLWEFKQVE